MADIILRLKKPWHRTGRTKIDAPALGNIDSGRLRKTPPEWGPERQYFSGDVDVAALTTWLHNSVGDSILDAVTVQTSEDDHSRLLITADDQKREELLTVPWEILEGSSGHLRVRDRMAVVRFAETGVIQTGPEKTEVKLRVLVSWANPEGDIQHIDAHLLALKKIADESDEAIDLKEVPFTSYERVRDEGSSFQPNVFYYFGHARQSGAHQVALQIGDTGKGVPLAASRFADLLAEIGLPRIVLVNACATVTGTVMNPYLGLAISCLQQADAVICMQTKIPVIAATRFGSRLISGLAEGLSLSRAVKRARQAMLAGHEIGPDAVPEFTLAIPVHFQRDLSDLQFTIAQGERARIRLQKRLEMSLSSVEPLLLRNVDKDLEKMLRERKGVTVVTGPFASGKSTSLRAAISNLLRADVWSDRYYVYYSATKIEDQWDFNVDRQSAQLLKAIHAQFGVVVRGLDDIAKQSSAEDHMRELAAWLREREGEGRHYIFVADDLPSALTETLAELASRVVDAGGLVLATRAASGLRADAVKRIGFDVMTPAEISAAKVDLAAIPANMPALPYWVATIRRGHTLEQDAADPAAKFIADYFDSLDTTAQEAVRRCALAVEALPRSVLEVSDDLLAPVLNDQYLARTFDGRISIDDIIRSVILQKARPEERIASRTAIYNNLVALIDAPETPWREATRLTNEAFRQAVALASLRRDDSGIRWLRLALDAATRLHDEYLNHDAITSMRIWEQYLSARKDLGISSERESDAYIGEALARMGELDRADTALDGVTYDDEAHDLFQVRALVTHAGVVKRLGEKGGWQRQFDLLYRALQVASSLLTGQDDREVQAVLGDVEQSLGNLLGYGTHANVDEAEGHLGRAVKIFEDLGNIRSYRATAEVIEIRRSNGRLSPEERAAAIVTIRNQADQLVIREMQEDAVLHLYELGRLETTPGARAVWFRKAFELAGRFRNELGLAGDAFAPLLWHAAVRWKQNEIDAGTSEAFPAGEEQLLSFVHALDKWNEHSWSRRIRRDAFECLAMRYAEHDVNKQVAHLTAAWQCVRKIAARREGRGDIEARERLADVIRRVPEASGLARDPLIAAVAAEG